MTIVVIIIVVVCCVSSNKGKVYSIFSYIGYIIMRLFVYIQLNSTTVKILGIRFHIKVLFGSYNSPLDV